jgi:hypothetical protein
MLLVSIWEAAAGPARFWAAQFQAKTLLRWRWLLIALSSDDRPPSIALWAAPLPRIRGGGQPAALPALHFGLVDADEIEALRRGHLAAAAAVGGLERRFELGCAPAAGANLDQRAHHRAHLAMQE